MSELPLLALAALLAGFIDAVAGGGGLVQVPALFNALPMESPATIFGTNKGSSIFGTANATWRYARRIAMPWDIALPAAASAFVFSFIGAVTVAWLPKDVVRPLVLVMMVVVVVYTAVKPDFGKLQGKAPPAEKVRPWALGVGAALGFYDGFFGPGAGSFMIFAFVGMFGLDFLRASSAAKIVNLSTNAAALCFFVPTGPHHPVKPHFPFGIHARGGGRQPLDVDRAVGSATANENPSPVLGKVGLLVGDRFVNHRVDVVRF